VETIPGLSKANTKLKGLQMDGQVYNQSQEADTTGVTAEKNIVRGTMEVAMRKVCTAMIAYATNEDNMQLKAKFSYSKGDFGQMRDQDIHTTASNIYDNALPYADKIGPFATAEDIATVKALADRFIALLPMHRTLTSKGATSTINLQGTIDSIMALITGTIDPLMKPMEFTQPTFYRDYMNARKIVNHGSRSSKDNGDTPQATTK